jgi:phosphinothricin acetyltransferase
MEIKNMEQIHWEGVKEIYQEGISTGNATFEESPPLTWEEWSKKHHSSCSLVCLDESKIVGWAAIFPVSSRPVYKGVGEVSLYVSTEFQGQGIGYALLNELILESEENGFWTLQAGIFPENQTSLDLHKELGFVEVGRRMKLGKMSYGPYKGEWRDVILLERRSSVIGLTNDQ